MRRGRRGLRHKGRRKKRGGGKGCLDSHQQTRFSTGTVTTNDQLSAEFRHLGEGVFDVWMVEEARRRC